IAHNAVIRIAATATLIENELDEAMAIFHVVAPGKVMPMAVFEQKFCIKEEVNRGKFNPYRRRFKIYRTTGYKDEATNKLLELAGGTYKKLDLFQSLTKT